MRSLTDTSGGRWQVVLGRESWGTVVAIFVPEEGVGGIRKALLGATDRGDGHDEIEGLSEAELLELLQRSEPTGAENP